MNKYNTAQLSQFTTGTLLNIHQNHHKGNKQLHTKSIIVQQTKYCCCYTSLLIYILQQIRMQ